MSEHYGLRFSVGEDRINAVMNVVSFQMIEDHGSVDREMKVGEDDEVTSVVTAVFADEATRTRWTTKLTGMGFAPEEFKMEGPRVLFPEELLEEMGRVMNGEPMPGYRVERHADGGFSATLDPTEGRS